MQQYNGKFFAQKFSYIYSREGSWVGFLKHSKVTFAVIVKKFTLVGYGRLITCE